MSSRSNDCETLVHEYLARYQPFLYKYWLQISEDVGRLITGIVIKPRVTFSDYPTRRALRDVALSVAYSLDYRLDTFGDNTWVATLFDNDITALFSQHMLTKFSRCMSA